MLTEPLNFLHEINFFKHYRHTGDKKVCYIKKSSRFPVKSHIVTDKSVPRNSICVLLAKRER